MDEEWRVICRVSGGVTGTRETLLKSNGIVRTLSTEEEARAEAQRMEAKNNNAYAVAFFEYWPVCLSRF